MQHIIEALELEFNIDIDQIVEAMGIDTRRFGGKPSLDIYFKQISYV